MIASAARAAAPMAKPLPIAAVVLPSFVQRVGDLAGVLAEARHLGDAAGVVRDRAVGVDGHRDADGGEHADRGDADAVETGEVGRDRQMIAQMVSIGITTDCMPTARPVIMTVAGPVSPDSAILTSPPGGRRCSTR